MPHVGRSLAETSIFQARAILHQRNCVISTRSDRSEGRQVETWGVHLLSIYEAYVAISKFSVHRFSLHSKLCTHLFPPSQAVYLYSVSSEIHSATRYHRVVCH